MEKLRVKFDQVRDILRNQVVINDDDNDEVEIGPDNGSNKGAKEVRAYLKATNFKREPGIFLNNKLNINFKNLQDFAMRL